MVLVYGSERDRPIRIIIYYCLVLMYCFCCLLSEYRSFSLQKMTIVKVMVVIWVIHQCSKSQQTLTIYSDIIELLEQAIYHQIKSCSGLSFMNIWHGCLLAFVGGFNRCLFLIIYYYIFIFMPQFPRYLYFMSFPPI